MSTKTGAKTYLDILKSELSPALGCTEPVAVAYAAARAQQALGIRPDTVEVQASRNILKNAMGVGIPGTDMVGLEIAAALGALAGDADAVLEVLHMVTPQDVEAAKAMRERGGVRVGKASTEKTLYIAATCRAGEAEACAVIEDRHTNVVRITRGDEVLYEKADASGGEMDAQNTALDVESIFRFVTEAPMEELSFLRQAAEMNRTIAHEGLEGRYGLGVGRNVFESMQEGSLSDYAVALTCAASDMRMSGGTLPVMTLCGSGNQGITATLPVIAAAQKLGKSEEDLLRALALSCLITVHVKRHIGRLSPLCGCGMGAAVGSCCGLTYLMGGGLHEIEGAIRNVIADVSGVICDGAKAGCSLKIATAVSSACRCSMLALHGSAAGNLDGIVCEDVERTIDNLGGLGAEGMAGTDQVILDMMVCKS